MQPKRLTLREYQQQLLDRIRATTLAGLAPSHLGFEAGDQLWAVPLADVSEVIPISTITSVPMTRSWFSGLANVRGSLYAVTDLGCFVTGTVTALTSECRFILLHERYRLHAALLIRRSLGLRHFGVIAEPDAGTPSEARGMCRDAEGHIWRELSVRMLAEDAKFSNIRR